MRIANDSDYGLSGSVWTTDVEAGIDVARRVRTGTYGINQFGTLDMRNPFGGFKASGVGRELGPEGLSAPPPPLLSVETRVRAAPWYSSASPAGPHPAAGAEAEAARAHRWRRPGGRRPADDHRRQPTTGTRSARPRRPAADIIPLPNSGAEPTEAGDRGGALQVLVSWRSSSAWAAIAALAIRESRRARARPCTAPRRRRRAGGRSRQPSGPYSSHSPKPPKNPVRSAVVRSNTEGPVGRLPWR